MPHKLDKAAKAKKEKAKGDIKSGKKPKNLNEVIARLGQIEEALGLK